MIDLRLGRWQDVLAGQSWDAWISDAPFSQATHDAETTRSDGGDADGLTPHYAAFTAADIREVCESVAPRTRGWMVSLTDSELFPIWRDEMARVGRYAFRAPVVAFIPGMSVRVRADGPSSWCLYAAVSRPMTRDFAEWGTLPGGYHIRNLPQGRAGGSERGGGRGKWLELMCAFVRDYSRPGDLVCDCFAGWGSTLAAAVSLGRSAIGAEMDPDAYREATRRLKRPLQVDLFAGGAA